MVHCLVFGNYQRVVVGNDAGLDPEPGWKVRVGGGVVGVAVGRLVAVGADLAVDQHVCVVVLGGVETFFCEQLLVGPGRAGRVVLAAAWVYVIVQLGVDQLVNLLAIVVTGFLTGL